MARQQYQNDDRCHDCQEIQRFHDWDSCSSVLKRKAYQNPMSDLCLYEEPCG